MKKELTEKQIAKRKATLRKARAMVAKLRARRRKMRFDPVVRRWNMWNHDFDTLLHELVKNPALSTVEPELIIKRAEQFADALHAMQDRRRPPSLTDEFDG